MRYLALYLTKTVFRISSTNLQRSFAVCQHVHIFTLIAREGSKVCFESKMLKEKGVHLNIYKTVRYLELLIHHRNIQEAYLLCRLEMHSVTGCLSSVISDPTDGNLELPCDGVI